MSRNYLALICAVLLLSVFDTSVARKYGRGGSHSYPKSGGLSGGGHHSYPSSGGLSGGGHGYPSSGGLSGGSHAYPSSGNSHGYPSSGNSHGYPASGGLSGSGTGNRYPSNTQTNSHGYPAAGGLSGNSRPGGQTTTNIHHHYHYNPPSQISYTPHGSAHPVSYPVYHGSPPNYVYQYKDSGSKYGTLLAGLALLNLGALGATAYALHSNNQNHASYKPQPGEYCKFGMRKENGDYEETRIDCQLITSFIFQAEAEKNHTAQNTTITSTTTVTNVTTVNEGGVVPLAHETNFTMLPNGSMVPVETTTDVITTALNTTDVKAPDQQTSSVTTTVTNTTVVSALEVKGDPVQVTPGMKCYVIRHSPTSDMKRSVPCGLLQTYAEKSIKPNSANRNAPVLTVFAAVLVAFIVY